MPPRVSEIFEALDMSPDSSVCPGLVRADAATLRDKRKAKAPLEEIVALERAQHFDADYVYFRRFVERPAMATAYIYDWTERLGQSRRARKPRKTSLRSDIYEDLARLHRRLWSAGEIPLVYIFLPTEVQVYHVLKGPRETRGQIEPDPFETIQIGEEISQSLGELKRFSARRLDDGRFWEEDVAAKSLELRGAAFMALSEELTHCRKVLHESHGIDPEVIKRLLILFVLVKYLEERKDKDGNGVFPEKTFARFAPGANDFISLLRAGGQELLAFLDYLAQADRFNGDVFHLDDSDRASIVNSNLGLVADFLGAQIEGNQRTLWRRYAFDELPVELISHLYEQFLPKQKGVVYTPPFLVQFILDEVLPLSADTPATFRLLDPACGSGVFLVGAFRRLVHRWRRQNGYAYPDVDTLKRILRDHIFGVDIEPEAVRLTMFSLSVALCDFLQPRVIWHDLRFDRLTDPNDSNLFKGDFFHVMQQRRWQETGEFDVIIGNPPFMPIDSTPASTAIANDLLKEEPPVEIPYNQAALLFLECVMRVAKPNGQVALIQPAGPLLYGENSSRFRTGFLNRYLVTQIVDLTHLSRVLFKRPRSGATQHIEASANNPADVAVVVIFAEKSDPDDSALLHVTVRRTIQAEQKLLFEIDHYDLHFVPREEARTNSKIWKANFIGGSRIPRFLARFEGADSLRSFLKKAKRTRTWATGEGYIAGDEQNIARLEELDAKSAANIITKKERDEFKHLLKRHRKASWLTGHRALSTEAFTSDGIDWSKQLPITQTYFAEPRQRELFEPPILLIKKVVEAEAGQIPMALVEEGVRFKKRIYGIHAPREDLAELKRIYAFLSNHHLVQFLLLAKSAEYLVNKSSAILSADILDLPFPKSTTNIRISSVEQAMMEDALEYAAEFKRKGDAAAILQTPDAKQLEHFGEFFCAVLGSVYSTLKRDQPIWFDDSICYPFYFGDKPTVQMDESNAGTLRLKNILSTNVGSSLRCQRILRVFHGNMLLLVKPPQLRYWLRSIAIRDADELFVELQGQGY